MEREEDDAEAYSGKAAGAVVIVERRITAEISNDSIRSGSNAYFFFRSAGLHYL